MVGQLIRIVAPHFVAGIECYTGPEVLNMPGRINRFREHKTAPIVKYMKRWTVADIHRYCAGKGWKVEHVSQK